MVLDQICMSARLTQHHELESTLINCEFKDICTLRLVIAFFRRIFRSIQESHTSGATSSFRQHNVFVIFSDDYFQI